MKSPVKLILCDLGNVLINFDHRIAVKSILPYCSKSFDEAYQLFFDSSLTEDYEEGRISSKVFFERMNQALGGRDLTYDNFSESWSGIFFDNSGMLALLREMKKDFRLHLVSNINELHYRYIQKHFPSHLDVFDRIILSYEVGRRKPHPLIYEAALASCGARACDALYIDDRKDLVEAAQALGIRSLVFTSAQDIRRQLHLLGLWPNNPLRS
ncbi:MAG: HAD family phosphatase [Candidatus Omnitrophota bacterium]